MTAGRVIVRARRQLAPKFDSRVESGASVADRIYAELKKAIVSGEMSELERLAAKAGGERVGGPAGPAMFVIR